LVLKKIKNRGNLQQERNGFASDPNGKSGGSAFSSIALTGMP